MLALTYDDGPNDPHTYRLLEVLAKHEVRATFFMIGSFVRQRPDIAREVAKAGHIVGHHTFSHPNLIFLSNAATRQQLSDGRDAITEAIGEHSNLFRPPFGGRRPGTLQIIRSMGFEPIMWNITGYDWRERPADYIVQKVSRQIRGGDVILLHDGSHAQFGADRSQTVIATNRLLERYKGEGYNFVSVPEMMSQGTLSSVPSSR